MTPEVKHGHKEWETPAKEQRTYVCQQTCLANDVAVTQATQKNTMLLPPSEDPQPLHPQLPTLQVSPLCICGRPGHSGELQL